MSESHTRESGVVHTLHLDPNGEFLLDEYVGQLLRRASQHASEVFHRAMVNHDITPNQFSVLMKLDEEDELSQNVLGRKTAMDPATILGVVSRLRRRNLVESRLDPSDGRRILVGLTGCGRELAGILRAQATMLNDDVLSALTKAEARSFQRLLRKLVHHEACRK